MQLLKKIIFSFYQPYVAKKIYRRSQYTWEHIHLHIPPGVFHPRFFFSTKFLLDTILRTEVKNKNILELGAGSGLISIACAKKGAHVTASDISTRVIEALLENSKSNSVDIKIIHSDLFDVIEDNHFDLIAINPPYYPKAARNELELAWYCGAEFEYFEKLFKQLGSFIHENTKVLMVLSEDCNLERIFSIAKKNHFIFKEIRKKKFWWEMNMIYEIEQIAGT